MNAFFVRTWPRFQTAVSLVILHLCVLFHQVFQEFVHVNETSSPTFPGWSAILQPKPHVDSKAPNPVSAVFPYGKGIKETAPQNELSSWEFENPPSI